VGTVSAQCNADLYSEKSIKGISPGYLFEKSFRIDGKGGRAQKIEYSCILSKDINYTLIMNTKEGGATGLVFELYDAQRNKVATNYINDKFFAGIEYKCRSTGIYFLSFSFKESPSQCGAAVLAFRR
jgi:nitrous oxidase accessory protein NosD